jgi:hypothetical protein
MSAQIQPAPESTTANNPDAAYQWFLDNRDEITAISNEIDFLACLQQIEQENDLPAGTAERFAAVHADANSVPEDEEVRYLTAWDAYHEALDADSTLATIARAYGQRTNMPIYDRINAEGTIVF